MRLAAKKATYVIPCIEFPGLCLTPLGTFFSREQFCYQQLIANVNTLKPIQIGFTFVSELQNSSDTSQLAVYQFNLHFDLTEDMFTEDSIKAYEGAGFNFQKHNSEGIRLLDFGELLTTSGLIASKLQWASFHSAFDFGFLTRSLCGGALPPDIRVFYKWFRKFFSSALDIKQLLRHPTLARKGLKPGMSLQEVADHLKINRWGQRHAAASDSMLTARVFLQLKNEFQPAWEEVARQANGVIYAIGSEPVLPRGAVIQSIFPAKSVSHHAVNNNNAFDGYIRHPFSSIPNA